MSESKLARRSLFVGASTVGAIAALSNFLPSAKNMTAPEATAPKPVPLKGGGYSLSDHVKQYYKTTRV
jgi:hypothetical protein